MKNVEERTSRRPQQVQMPTRRVLTDRFVRSIKPPSKGRALHYDALVPGLAVSVTDRGARTFVLYTRYQAGGPPARRALGAVGALTLTEARDKARGWLSMIARGIDPAEEVGRQRRADDRRRGNTFEAVLADFLQRPKKRGSRKAKDVAREMRRELLARWADWSLTEIDHHDIKKAIEEIRDRGALYQAHNVFGHVRTFFGWAYRTDQYGLERNPVDRLEKADILDPKEPRQRVLSDAEIAAVWHAAGEMGYPAGSAYRMLLLTGQRKSEVIEAQWSEFDLNARVWTVPPERFKSGVSQLVALSDDAMALLDELPRWNGGEYLFSTTAGRKPINGHSKAKARLDSVIARTLGKTPAGWVIHDIRRTVRTRLSELRVPHAIAEMVIGHGKKGLDRVYDQHLYLNEMREALEAWAARLRAIVDPPPANVVPLRVSA